MMHNHLISAGGRLREIRVNQPQQGSWGHTLALEPRFEPMIATLEARAAADPTRYGRSVVAAGMLGYLVLGGVLASVAALVFGVVALMYAFPRAIGGEIKLLLPLGAVLLGLMRAMKVAWPDPDGVAVGKEEARALHALVEQIRSVTGGPKVHDIRITDVMNASITQQRRFLVFGARNTLYLGLPLLNAMRLIEVEAIIAHEMGHFVGRHGRSAAFTYLIRARWMQVAERLPNGIVAGGLRRFFGWYGPWFAAYSFVFARRQEYEADAVAAAVAGPAAAGHALTRIALQSQRLDIIWDMIWSQSALRPDPPASPQRTLAAVLLDDDEQAPAMLARTLAMSPALDDTHPGLAERLDALGVAATPPPPLEEAAAPALLGDVFVPITERLDAEWHAAADAGWAENYARRQDQIQERERLDGDAAAGLLDADAQFRRAELIEVLDGPFAGAAAFAELVASNPQAYGALFRQGDALLDAGNEDGIDLLLRAAEAEPTLRVYASRRLARHYMSVERPDLAAPYFAEVETAEAAAVQERAEASAIDEKVVLRPLDASLRDQLAELASGMKGLRRLEAALRDLSTGPQIVFVFSAHRGQASGELLDRLIDTLLPAGDLFGVERSRQRRWLQKRIRAFPTSQIAG